ncbi:MAG: NADP-dependent isocitrate dehydrogenase [Rickettsiaceae bacterium]|nr:NADP-dependent isocitrate dehydrogenase [Rickettsiaceae bacterium]
MRAITVAYGDGIGPEIMDAVLHILKEAKTPLTIETIEIGEKLYRRNYTSGINEAAWESIARTKVLLKAPITTPQGGGYKSLNVTLRKALGLFANVRPVICYSPFIKTAHPNLDLVIVRENEEDLYAGIEYRHSHNCYESIKLITSTGSEKIIRYAFEYARQNNKKLVSCLSKDNIMKFSDGIFHKIFDKVAVEYADIKNNHYIVDIGTARIATKPELFEVIVTSNLYGDIISDVAAEVSGSVGIAGSANVGTDYAMFEAVHGSAPDIAGKDIANPSGLLNAAIMMLVYLDMCDHANLIENAWKVTIEEGIHTTDIYGKGSRELASTKNFAAAVVARLGKIPKTLATANYRNKNIDSTHQQTKIFIDSSEEKTLHGVDVFCDIKTTSPTAIANKILQLDLAGFELKTLASKGLKLWPSNQEDFQIMSDHWQLRFMRKDESVVNHSDISILLANLAKAQVDFVQTANLYKFGTKLGYSLAQGE